MNQQDEEIDFLFHKADCVIEAKSLHVADPPNSEQEFEDCTKSLGADTASTAKDLKLSLEFIMNKVIDDLEDTSIDLDEPQISELVIWIDTKTAVTGGHL